ncbi:tRNA (adenosine(37)-N6)-threonylcarbamoyltransferase complex dimerization subunit type 1 TsaB [Palleronia sediminis]|uniref:tRNA (Adenosine(37)-N6)-threonylcarbamoyltransferase complex dimerization subunit type 1 TsaB n=1 Tax=Palleronia sediminis TaxID=2547833 RepID=A0A4R6AHJ0_9RHOB|nr:tRNA (adenosine(37)-N6)-threonylcarbamoyltransferase complex dimerization subunit type 1 TsaB [Palleronia sediminis]TDL81928.1 tRNA (adenosine(37)-N6)-threonylcarbamoyltransferase complex dimerization subunit type 1 TsaB [Palleronia sediminis]
MPDPRPTLGFDTSAAHCAAALLSGERIVAHRHEDMTRGQAERLMVLLGELLQEAGAEWADLDRIAVGVGPGNFTGIRISVAAARGLSMGLGIPAVGVSTLDALGLGCARPCVTSVDARGGKLYLAAEGGAPEMAALDALPPLPDGARVIGFEAARLAAACGGRPAEPAMPLAEAIARIGAAADPGAARPAPLYIRAPDAAPARPAPPIA